MQNSGWKDIKMTKKEKGRNKIQVEVEDDRREQRGEKKIWERVWEHDENKKKRKMKEDGERQEEVLRVRRREVNVE